MLALILWPKILPWMFLQKALRENLISSSSHFIFCLCLGLLLSITFRISVKHQIIGFFFFPGIYSKTSTIFIYTQCYWDIIDIYWHIILNCFNLMIRDRALMKREFLFANLYTFSFFCNQLILPWYSLSFKKSSRMEPLYLNILFG